MGFHDLGRSGSASGISRKHGIAVSLIAEAGVRRDSARPAISHKWPHPNRSLPEELRCISGRSVDVDANGETGSLALEHAEFSTDNYIPNARHSAAIEEQKRGLDR